LQLFKQSMLKVLLFFTFLVAVTEMASQSTDYAVIRDDAKKYSCSATDTSGIYNTIRNLQALDTTRITHNMYLYYQDLGICYWLLSGGDKDNPDLSKAITLLHQSLYHNPLSTSGFHTLFFLYNFAGDCAKSKYYMDQYKLNTKKKYWDKEQEKALAARCNE
jgi:hypothetical protein